MQLVEVGEQAAANAAAHFLGTKRHFFFLNPRVSSDPRYPCWVQSDSLQQLHWTERPVRQPFPFALNVGRAGTARVQVMVFPFALFGAVFPTIDV